MIAYPRHFFAKFGKTPVIAYSSSFERKHFTISRTVFFRGREEGPSSRSTEISQFDTDPPEQSPETWSNLKRRSSSAGTF